MALEWISGYPFIAVNNTGTSVTASGAINESGFISALVIPTASGTPTDNNIIASESPSGHWSYTGISGIAATASGAIALTCTGLTPNVAYTMWLVPSGGVTNTTLTGWGLTFSSDVIAPSWSGAYPALTLGGTTSGVFSLALNDIGSGFALALADSAAAPTAAAIRTSGQAIGMAASGTVYPITVTGLVGDGRIYHVYFTAQDEAPNLMATGYLLAYTTTDVTAPTWEAGYPAIRNVYGASGVFNLSIDSIGRGYLLVVASGTPIPTSAAIKLSGTVVDMPIPSAVYTITTPGLTSETNYVAYAAAEDTITLNMQASGYGLKFTTSDISAPTWAAGYPSGTSTTSTTITYALKANEPCSGWSFVLTSGAPTPTAATIKSMGTAFNLPAATGLYSIIESGVAAPITDYMINLVLQDASGNLQSSGWTIYMATADITAPSWSTGYPSVVTEYATSGTFALSVDSATCSGFVLALPATSGVPTASGIRASGTAVTMTSGSVVYNVTVTGLVTNTDYIGYAAAQDATPNLQASGWGIVFSTDVTAPTWTTASIGSITTTSCVLTLKMNDAGNGYCVIVPSGSAAPNATQIKAGQDSTSTAVAAGLAGSTALAANTNATISFSLQYSTYYTAYVTGTDDGGNDVAAVVSASFRAGVPNAGIVGGLSQRERRRRRDKRIRSAIGRSMYGG